jgi:AraC-like DNA-binding protein
MTAQVVSDEKPHRVASPQFCTTGEAEDGGSVKAGGWSRTWRLVHATGATRLIRDRRLAEATRCLSRTDGKRRPMMAQLAHACGFNHPTVFARAFRRKYGINLSEVTPGSTAVAGVADGSNAALIRWLRDL